MPTQPSVPAPINGFDGHRRFFVAGISRTITADDLKKHFSHFGAVTEARVQKDSAGLNLGYGFVAFEKPCEAVLNVEHRLNGQLLDVQIPRNMLQSSQPPAVSMARPNPPPPGPPPRAPARKRSRSRTRSRSPAYRRENSRSRHRSASRGATRRHTDPAPPPPGPPPRYQQQAHGQPQLPRSQPPPVSPIVAQPQHASPVAVTHSQAPLGTVGGAEYVVCVPYNLCPPQYLRDPRVFVAFHDASTGQLTPVQVPLGGFPPATETTQVAYHAATHPPPSNAAPRNNSYY